MKILVISSNLIGDTILSTGVIEYYAKFYPSAKFTFLIGPTAGQIYENFPSLEKIIPIKKKKFNIHWLNMYQQCKSIKWDLIIDLRSSLLSYFLQTKKRFIFKKNKKMNHIQQLNRSFNLKIPDMYINNNEKEELIVKKFLDNNFRNVVIFPGGNWIPKIWPVKNFNKLMQIIYNEFSNIKFIIVGSIKEKNLYCDPLKKNLPKNAFIDLMGESLTLTSAYMKKSDIFIGNDSGLMHLSVASKLPTIGLFGPTNDVVYGHRKKNCFVIRTKDSYQFFSKKNLNYKKSYMSTIEPEKIFNLIIKNKLL